MLETKGEAQRFPGRSSESQWKPARIHDCIQMKLGSSPSCVDGKQPWRFKECEFEGQPASIVATAPLLSTA